MEWGPAEAAAGLEETAEEAGEGAEGAARVTGEGTVPLGAWVAAWGSEEAQELGAWARAEAGEMEEATESGTVEGKEVFWEGDQGAKGALASV